MDRPAFGFTFRSGIKKDEKCDLHQKNGYQRVETSDSSLTTTLMACIYGDPILRFEPYLEYDADIGAISYHYSDSGLKKVVDEDLRVN